MSRKWDYKSVSFVTINATAIADFNAEGLNGWELIGFQGTEALFKREDAAGSTSNWEYEIVNVANREDSNLAASLDAYGAAGWELIGFVNRRAIFKKGAA